MYINTPDCSFEKTVKCLIDVCFKVTHFPHSFWEIGTFTNRPSCLSLILEWRENICLGLCFYPLLESIGFAFAYISVFCCNSSFYPALEMLVAQCLSFPATRTACSPQAFYFSKMHMMITGVFLLQDLFLSMSAFIQCPSI
ncbi:hypothetical protein FQN60_008555 [Etheostoma spectabile]|uniref:Uncharacterized protein n=1 Tax=Etheostoma spectabile TaxID=54343 RepID=A0A5J5C6U5_9PERO|nr:hypothetical protein FQN60_008555 [Etheostoma spectabile]